MPEWEDIEVDEDDNLPANNPPPTPATSAEDEDPFKKQRANLDPLVFTKKDSNPELRWDAAKAPKRKTVEPAPKRISSGTPTAPWIPGGAPKEPRRQKHVTMSSKAFVAVIAGAVPLGLLLAVAVFFLKQYALL